MNEKFFGEKSLKCEGTEKVKKWVENNGSYEELLAIEEIGRDDYLKRRSEILIYS